MNADRIDFYANQLRGVSVSDIGRKLREVLRDATNEAESFERKECAMVCHCIGVDQRRNRLATDGAFVCRDAIRARGKA